MSLQEILDERGGRNDDFVNVSLFLTDFGVSLSKFSSSNLEALIGKTSRVVIEKDLCRLSFLSQSGEMEHSLLLLKQGEGSNAVTLESKHFRRGTVFRGKITDPTDISIWSGKGTTGVFEPHIRIEKDVPNYLSDVIIVSTKGVYMDTETATYDLPFDISAS